MQRLLDSLVLRGRRTATFRNQSKIDLAMYRKSGKYSLKKGRKIKELMSKTTTSGKAERPQEGLPRNLLLAKKKKVQLLHHSDIVSAVSRRTDQCLIAGI